MGDSSAFNVRELLKQLGIKSVAELPVIKAIQPSLTIGDASGITSPLVAPTSMAGGVQTGAAATVAGARIVAGPTGCYVRAFNYWITLTGNVAWEIVVKPGAVATVVSALIQYPFTPSAPASYMELITYPAGSRPGTNSPRIGATAAVQYTLGDVLYIPGNSVFEFTMNGVNQSMYAWAILQDVAAPNFHPEG